MGPHTFALRAGGDWIEGEREGGWHSRDTTLFLQVHMPPMYSYRPPPIPCQFVLAGDRLILSGCNMRASTRVAEARNCAHVRPHHPEEQSQGPRSEDRDPGRAVVRGQTPPRYNGAPSQEHWVIRQHPETGERTLDRLTWGLIPGWIKEAVAQAQAHQCHRRAGGDGADVPARLRQAALPAADRQFLRVEGDQGRQGQAALCHRHEERRAVRAGRHLGRLAPPGDGARWCARSASSPPTPTSWWPTSTTACR